MIDYIVTPLATFQEFYEIIMPHLLVQTPIQEGYCRVRLSQAITPTDNIVDSVEPYVLPSGELLGVFA